MLLIYRPYLKINSVNNVIFVVIIATCMCSEMSPRAALVIDSLCKDMARTQLSCSACVMHDSYLMYSYYT